RRDDILVGLHPLPVVRPERVPDDRAMVGNLLVPLCLDEFSELVILLLRWQVLEDVSRRRMRLESFRDLERGRKLRSLVIEEEFSKVAGLRALCWIHAD